MFLHSPLKTEARNPRTMNLDKATPIELVRMLNEESRRAVEAVAVAEREIAEAIERISEGMSRGGRLIYVGAGTSGRLGALDAAECPPTFGVGYDRVVALMAGGEKAFFKAAEGAEDNAEAGRGDIAALNITADDSVVGISAAGGAKYVVAAVEYAAGCGAFTAAVVCNPDTPLGAAASLTIFADTGAEALTGSTRLKAGTAQKLILNSISTGVMARLGYVYENIMINVKPTNEKLLRRAAGIAAELSSSSLEKALAAVEAEGSVMAAIERLKGEVEI